MTWGAVAVGVGTVAAGYMSSEASKDAASAGSDAAGRASDQIQAAADQARRDVQTYIPAAQRDLLAGYQSAGDIFSQGIPEQQRLLSGGNLAAQQTTAGGFDQYRSALLGLPVDQSNWQPRQVAPSAPIQNPLQGGMFSDIGGIAQARTLEDAEQGRIMDLVARAEGGRQNPDALKAQRALIARGYDPFGRILGEGGAEALTANLDNRAINRLVTRAANQGGRGQAEAIEGLKLRGLNRLGQPL